MDIHTSFSSYEIPRDYLTLSTPLIKKSQQGYTRPSRRLLIDNRDRVSGNVFDFEIRFGNGYRSNSVGVSEYHNVTSVDMKILAFPKILNEDYVVVDISQFRDYTNLDASNNAANHAFCVGFFDSSQLTPGDTKPVRDFMTQRVLFDPPLPKLDRINARFLVGNGDIVHGGLTGGNTRVSMLLEVSTM